jgi:hypothetical protein
MGKNLALPPCRRSPARLGGASVVSEARIGRRLAPRDPNGCYLTITQPYMLSIAKCGVTLHRTRYRPGVENVYSNDEVAGGEFGALSASRFVGSLMNRFGGKAGTVMSSGCVPALYTATWWKPAMSNVTVPPPVITLVRGIRLSVAFGDES